MHIVFWWKDGVLYFRTPVSNGSTPHPSDLVEDIRKSCEAMVASYNADTWEFLT